MAGFTWIMKGLPRFQHPSEKDEAKALSWTCATICKEEMLTMATASVQGFDGEISNSHPFVPFAFSIATSADLIPKIGLVSANPPEKAFNLHVFETPPRCESCSFTSPRCQFSGEGIRRR